MKGPFIQHLINGVDTGAKQGLSAIKSNQNPRKVNPPFHVSVWNLLYILYIPNDLEVYFWHMIFKCL